MDYRVKVGTVYAIVNITNQKAYIGSSGSVKRRWNKHRSTLRRGCHVNPHLQSAWNKYSEDMFEFVILEENIPDGQLIQREQDWLDGTAKVYNCGLVVRASRKGCKHTAETRRRMSEAQRGKKHSAETRRKISEIQQGKKLSKEHRRKISDALRGRVRPKEICQKISEGLARPYPAFYHCETGEVIPAGRNLNAMCRERGLHVSNMCAVATGRRRSHKGWEL